MIQKAALGWVCPLNASKTELGNSVIGKSKISSENSSSFIQRFDLIGTGIPVIGIVALGIFHLYANHRGNRVKEDLAHRLDMAKKQNEELRKIYKTLLSEVQKPRTPPQIPAEEDARSQHSSPKDAPDDNLSRASSSAKTNCSSRSSRLRKEAITLKSRLDVEKKKNQNLLKSIADKIQMVEKLAIN